MSRYETGYFAGGLPFPRFGVGADPVVFLRAEED